MVQRRARSGGGGGDFSVDVDSVLFGDKQNETGSQRDAHGKKKKKERDRRVRGGLTVTETKGTWRRSRGTPASSCGGLAAQ